MLGLDEWIAGFGDGQLLILASVVAVLLRLRHATDPDHLTAVSTLVAVEPDRCAPGHAHGPRLGAGHATTLFVFGVPIVVFASYLPPRVEQLAEAAIGLLIIGLVVGLLVRWRRGQLHVHEHEHGDRSHSHLRGRTRAGTHAHARRPIDRTRRTLGEPGSARP